MSAATWNTYDAPIGHQAIDATDTTQNHKLGEIIKAHNATYGMGEFIYLLGVASTVVGSLVTYNASTYQTALASDADAETAASVAVAMSANVASQYGWYQIGGIAVIKKTAVVMAPQVPVYLSGTAGRIKALKSEGLAIVGAATANLTSVTTTTSTVLVTINRPHLQGFRSA